MQNDSKIARPVVIKILYETYRWDKEFKKKGRHEAKIAARQLHRARLINLRGKEK